MGNQTDSCGMVVRVVYKESIEKASFHLVFFIRPPVSVSLLYFVSGDGGGAGAAGALLLVFIMFSLKVQQMYITSHHHTYNVYIVQSI